ncbi:MAG: leucyl-tRNA synthetase [Parcubacteria group bacterium Athens1014_10]|nr:MAG: leucyl-tRNA synthetase [Parcubacteria group bacterium Athens1014_10]TSD05928.1 MAG: leucyl-tRNA synthetase [Parcubacteria group bacterium Athens0714_12]
MSKKENISNGVKYEAQKIEKKWQAIWNKIGINKTSEDNKKSKFYCLDMFPYPSGEGLHVGHMRGYTYSDVIARKRLMEGYNVLHPMGWDAFGLPAENYALKTGVHPRISTEKNISIIKEQLKNAGYLYDWQKEVNTSQPEYYKWTQWLFLQFYKKGLAYKKMALVNWCPSCQTVLANEQVKDGKCERCCSEITKKELNQWFLKITQYADRLIEDLDLVDWPEKVKIMQRNWIGRSYGVEFEMPILDEKGGQKEEVIRVYTTRVDTVFGMTYAVLSPEHPLVESLTAESRKKEVEEYIKQAKEKTEIERMSEEKEKTGVFTGAYALNPFNQKQVPVYIGDYVLAEYGTGAIMAVPAHDQRDYFFAEKHSLEIIEVIKSEDGRSTIENGAFEEDGVLIESEKFNGLSSERAQEEMTKWLEDKGIGFGTKKYKLRDWLISRQRYWGVPIPIIYCEHCGEIPVLESDLPLVLPEIEDFKPLGEKSPLAKAEKFVKTKCPKCGAEAKRETDTMDTFVDSAWYYLRYVDPKNSEEIFEKKKIKYWLPTDLYVGGIEHAVLHLLYARFFSKIMFDLGIIEFEEPFLKLFNQGMIYRNGEKMSKSKGNVVNPNEFFIKYGADTMRLYELFMSPPEQDAEWQDRGVIGVYRFLNKVWDLVSQQLATNNQRPNLEIEKLRHQTIKKVSEDIEKFKFNTMIACLMEYVNKLTTYNLQLTTHDLEILILLLAPLAPHLSEELWHQLKGLPEEKTIFEEKWPDYNPDLIIDETIELIIQINSKVRDKMEIKINISEEEVKKMVLEREKIKKWLENREIKKIIYINNRLINIVAN